MLILTAGFAPGTVVTLGWPGTGSGPIHATADANGIASFGDMNEQQVQALGGEAAAGLPDYPHTYIVQLTIGNYTVGGVVLIDFARGVLLDPYGNPPYGVVPYGGLTEQAQQGIPAYSGLAFPASAPTAVTSAGGTLAATGPARTPSSAVLPSSPGRLTINSSLQAEPQPQSSGGGGFVLLGAAALIGGALWLRSQK